MMAPYKLRRRRNLAGEYVWLVIDITTDYTVKWDVSRSPTRAPAHLRETLERLNRRYVVDKILVQP
jgi:hypothetical protein